jgi:HSP20 family protein
MLKSNLFEELMTIQDSFDKAFGRILTYPARTRFEQPADSVWTPAIEAFQKDETVAVRVFLPGVDEKNISLELKENVLTVSGERLPIEGGAHILRSEMPYGKFLRRIALPEELLTDDQKCKAVWQDGVLEITMPIVSQDLRARQIPIESKKEEKLVTA